MKEKVVIIVPAFNEGLYLGKMLDSLLPAIRECNNANAEFEIAKVIVVDDGSTDNTGKIAAKKGVEVIRIEKNSGKAFAFFKGLQLAKKDCATISVIMDADLKNIKWLQLYQLVEPVARKHCLMAVGRRRYGPVVLSGERAFRMSALEPLLRKNAKWEEYFGIKNGEKIGRMGFGLEKALNIIFCKDPDKVREKGKAIAADTFFEIQRLPGQKKYWSKLWGKIPFFRKMEYSRQMSEEMEIPERIQHIRNQQASDLKKWRSKRFAVKPIH